MFVHLFIFVFKQKTAYELRISDWSSDVCSSDLTRLSESGNAERADCTFGATGQHNVSIIHCDHAGRIANAVRARRTGRDNGVVRAHQAIFNTDLPRNQVDATTMNEMWGNSSRSLFVEHNGLPLSTLKAAHTRTNQAASHHETSIA